MRHDSRNEGVSQAAPLFEHDARNLRVYKSLTVTGSPPIIRHHLSEAVFLPSSRFNPSSSTLAKSVAIVAIGDYN